LLLASPLEVFNLADKIKRREERLALAIDLGLLRPDNIAEYREMSPKEALEKLRVLL
jgi:hypothetical protein